MDAIFLSPAAAVYAVLNVLAFTAYARDKFRAKTNAARTRESHLILAAALGPFGALAAMLVFRHKIRHLKFIIVPFILLLHLFLFLWIRYRVFS